MFLLQFLYKRLHLHRVESRKLNGGQEYAKIAALLVFHIVPIFAMSTLAVKSAAILLLRAKMATQHITHKTSDGWSRVTASTIFICN